MTDPKENKDDIVATEAEAIADETLEEVDGGFFSFSSSSFQTHTFSVQTPGVGTLADTIYAGAVDDDIGTIGVLRRRPTR